jgi:phosphomevalonate kinase
VTGPFAASAPGKLFLGGEYAVLHGGEAVVTAVSVRAAATLRDGARGRASPIVRAVRECAAPKLGRRAAALPAIAVDTSSFSLLGRKLGLGSSAATTAAATGSLFEWAGLPIERERGRILGVALEAHRRGQGGRGSGADVAVSVEGGTIVFAAGRAVEPISLRGVEAVAVWTGKPASTVLLLAQVDALAARDPALHGSCLTELVDASRELAAAFRAGAGDDIVRATAGYGEGMRRLGDAAGAPIVTVEHEAVSRLAREAGGAAKPSGAGGGDAAVAVFEDGEGARRFGERCRAAGFAILELAMHAPGLRRDG